VNFFRPRIDEVAKSTDHLRLAADYDLVLTAVDDVDKLKDDLFMGILFSAAITL